MENYKHILFPTALTQQSVLIGKRVAKIAEQVGAKLTLVHVIEPEIHYGNEVEYPNEMMMEKKRNELADLAKEIGAADADQQIQIGAPKHAILDFAKEIDCDLIIVASHSEHGYAHLLGSTAIAVVHNAPCDVLTIRVGGPLIKDYDNALFATALVEHSDEVAQRAVSFTNNTNAKLSVLHVVEPVMGYGFGTIGSDAIEAGLESKALKQLTDLANEAGISEESLSVKEGSPKSLILETAHEYAADLIIIASHGKHGVAHLLGSTAITIVHSAKCDVLTVRVKD